MPYLILTGLMLLEILLLAGGFLIFRRYLQPRLRKRQGHGQESHADRLLTFLDFEIQRMQKIVEESPAGDANRQALLKRLAVFNSERNMLVELRAGGKLDGYPELITKYYQSADVSSTPEYDKLQGAIGTYQERIANLEKFRTLFFRSQDDLAKSVNRTVDLKRRLDQEILNEEEKNKLIQMLKEEKARLAKELNIADHELEAIMANIGQLHDTELDCNLPDKAEVDAIMGQMRAIEEENEFLQVQIQYLLKAEVEKDSACKEEMIRLKQELATQVGRYEELEAKFADMEARYLQAVS